MFVKLHVRKVNEKKNHEKKKEKTFHKPDETNLTFL